MGFSYNVNVLNQKGSPAIYTDTFANRPAAGFVGRLFIANDTSAIYEDTGTAWVLIANVSSGAGTLQQVTTNGNTSNVGISVTAGGISSNTLTVTSLTPGSVAFVGAADLVTEDNANLFWDDTNNRLGIGTNTPGNVLDLHSALTTAILALNNTAGNQSLISFLNTSVAKWRIGNTAANNFEILNVGLSAIAMTINVSNNSTDLGNNTIFSAYSYLTGLTSGTSGQTNLKIGTTTAGVPGGYYSIVPLSSGLLNFSSNLSAGNYRIFNIDSNSLTDSTIRTFTLPDASGTVALTSNLSAYLPLAGGTLTGALNGTSATFNGNLNMSTSIATIKGGDTTGRLTISNSDTNAYLILNGSANGNSLALVTNTFITFNSGSGFSESVRITPLRNLLINSTTDDTVNKLQVTGSGTFTSNLNLGGYLTGQGANPGGLGGSRYVIDWLSDSMRIFSYGANTSTNGAFLLNSQRSDGSNSLNVLSIAASGVVTIVNLAGTGSRAVLADANGVLSAPVSDQSIKENIETLHYGLDTIMQLNPVQFEFIDTYKNYGEGLQIGNIAQDIEKIIPEAVFVTPSTGLKGIDYNQFHGIYIKAIQDQQKIIQGLIERIEQLENK
jgi:hypothetical protein